MKSQTNELESKSMPASRESRPEFNRILEKAVELAEAVFLAAEQMKIADNIAEDVPTYVNRELRRLFLSLEKIIKCMNFEDNSKIFAFAYELAEKAKSYGTNISGDSSESLYACVGRIVYKDDMDRPQSLSLIYSVNDIAFTSGFLNSGGSERVGLQDMDRNQLVGFGNDILSHHYSVERGIYSQSDANLDFEIWKTHHAYMVWNPIFKFLNLDALALDDLLSFGEQYNDGYLWNEIIKSSKKQWGLLSYDEKRQIATRIAKLYALNININPESPDVLNKVMGFGGPVSSALSGWLLSQ